MNNIKRFSGMKNILFCLLMGSSCIIANTPAYAGEADLHDKQGASTLNHAPIGAVSSAILSGRSGAVGDAGKAEIKLVARFQQYNANPRHPSDHYDSDIYSPKSVTFSSLSQKVYVNSLEGMSTVVYDTKSLSKIGVIRHRFGRSDKKLFPDDDSIDVWQPFPSAAGIRDPNIFGGKPVEFTWSHNGRYLWVSYYRRSYDQNGVLPSAVAVIDTRSDEIVRVMPAGPVPKIITSSPDGRWLAVVHWGNNTVGLIDISSNAPSEFRHSALIEVERRYSPDGDGTANRDSDCGFCLRGTVFSSDSRYLLVGRMREGGISVIDVNNRKYLGTVFGMKPTPRHLLLSGDGKILYVSSNVSGYVSSYNTDDIIIAVLSGRTILKPLKEVNTGRGTRTIALSPDGRLLFAAVHRESRIVIIDTEKMDMIAAIPTDPYPVGMDISPDGSQLWVTSQGYRGNGGNSVTVYRVSVDQPSVKKAP